MIYTILILLVLGLSYTVYNLLNKVEKYEERILEKTEEVELLLLRFNNILNKMREIDNKKIFESDDEVGGTFEMLKDLIETNNQLFLKYSEEDGSDSSSR